MTHDLYMHTSFPSLIINIVNCFLGFFFGFIFGGFGVGHRCCHRLMLEGGLYSRCAGQPHQPTHSSLTERLRSLKRCDRSLGARAKSLTGKDALPCAYLRVRRLCTCVARTCTSKIDGSAVVCSFGVKIWQCNEWGEPDRSTFCSR